MSDAVIQTGVSFIRYRIRKALNRITGHRLIDDFYWHDYNDHYRGELRENEKHHTVQITPGDFAFVDGVLQPVRDVPPLHPNHRLLYETIVQLRPASVLELGCGGGDHLHNLHVLAPEIELHGIDREPKQLAFLRERYPDLDADVRIADATLHLPSAIDRVDLAFTQAVIMHLHDGDGHRVALTNLFRLARTHVVLMENWRRHEYVDDLQDLHRSGIINWPELHLYYREAPELGRPHILVASRDVLDYPALEDFAILRDIDR
jgi:SAM-dependent methyltransferase